MNPEFWHERWQNQQIGFHQEAGGAELKTHFSRLGLQVGGRVFVPLCGKSRDVSWLLAQGCQVVAAELSQIAVDALFEGLKLTPTIEQLGDMRRYSADALTVYVGDIFNLTASDMGRVDAIYDRAALVALPAGMRMRYSKHLIRLTNCAPQLIVSLSYAQGAVTAPPFSVDAQDVAAHYAQYYDIKLLETHPTELRGEQAVQAVWLLQPQ